MPSLATALGLRAADSLKSPPALTGYYLIFHFIFTYAVTTPRHLKQFYGIDNNANPREDITKYGEAAVKSGKLTQAQLDHIKRNAAAHANTIENYPAFLAALLWAHVAGVPPAEMRRATGT